MIEVSTPDGGSVSFPDDTDADTIHNVMQQHFGKPEPDVTTDVAKSIGSGLVKGAKSAAVAGPLAIHGLAGLIAQGVNYLAPQSDFAKSLNEGLAQAESNRQVIQKATGPHFYEHTPETTAGKYGQTGAEFLPGAVTGPGGIVRRVITQALAPAAVSETAGQVFEGTPLETPARIGGALVGGGAGATLAVPPTAERALASRLPSYVTPEHINRAEELINEAGQRGVTLTWPEALSRATGKPVLTDTQRLLESAGETRGKMGNILAPRPEQMDAAAQNEFAKIAPPPAQPSAIGPQAQETARGTLNDVRQIINAHTEPFYKVAEATPISAEDMAMVKATPGYQELRDQIRNDPHLNKNVAHLPDDSVGFLNQMKIQYDQQAKTAKSRLNPTQNQTRAASLASGAQTMRDTAIKASPAYKIALDAQAQTRRQYLDPLMAGPLGKMTKTPETQRAINALFPQDPLPNSHNEIATAVSALAKRNPWAATQLVRAHVEGAFNDATKKLVGGPNPFGAAGWAKAIAGNPQQYENLKAAVKALPDGDARWSSFENLLDIATATGERQAIGSKTAFNAQDLAAMSAGGTPLTKFAKVAAAPAEWLRFAGEKIKDWQAGKNMEALAELITDPKSGDTFRKIAMAKGKRETQLLAARLLAAGAAGARSGENRDRLQVRIPGP